MRNLEREIGNVCRKVARQVVKKGAKHKEEITAANINEFLGVARFRDSEVHEKSEVGLVTGLAWTEVGGSILTTEVQVLDGKGKLTITGQLGDVMQESAQAALSYIRGRAQALGLSREFYRNVDLHLHVPEGAIPKDGPSAGITMATALASALAKIPVRRDIAMTGEITLRGKVLAIGGLKEKLLAALRAGIFEVILPRANEKDLAELPDNIKNSMKLHFVDSMDEVLALALESPLPTLVPPETEVLAAVPPASEGAVVRWRGSSVAAARTTMRYTTQFLLSALSAAQFPAPDVPEIAFLGRSNVGKSSLLNALVGEKAAKVSQTPGRTRAINFFALLDQKQRRQMIFADLPGYGYAKISKSISAGWPAFIEPYLAIR